MVARNRNLEALCLRQAERVGETVRQMFTEIAGVWQAPRPGRSFPRRSRKPVGKWKPEKTARVTGSVG